ncbi:MAG: phosphoserine phosphatase RsbU/P [Verrucomicrobiota bacterium]|jgi:DNA-binding response OmpR family regulator
MDDIQFHPIWEQLPARSPSALGIELQLQDEGIQVIIAEDDPVWRKLVTTVIELGGFRTIVTKDGDEAMWALRAQRKPCLAVIDWTMPGMDGAEICRRMRESNRSVYIIMVTSRDSKKDTVLGINQGADDYLVKPSDPEELLARIRAGVRILTTQETLANRVQALETTASEIGSLKLRIPL